MPLLDDTWVQWMQGQPAWRCPQCGRMVRKNYCRQHDVFFYEGHAAGCPSDDKEHETHRRYNLETGKEDPPVWKA